MEQFYTDGITTHDTCITKDDRIYGYWMSNLIGVSLVILDWLRRLSVRAS